uniref:Uncharacterized protein n=1 Tax=Trichogramma kaykai TaxID=54128 RepID=A0ABD2VSV1_9HYME
MTRKSHAISSKAGFRRYASSLTIFPNLKAYKKSARGESTCVAASIVERQHLQISRRKAPPICGARVVVGVLICLCRLRLQKGRDAFYTR